MEIKLEWTLEQVDHLLEGVECDDPVIVRTIQNLRNEVKGLIHLCSVGHFVAAELGLQLIAPRIDEVITEIGERKTDPGA